MSLMEQSTDGFLDETENKEIRDCTQMVSQEYRSIDFVSLDKIIPIIKDPMADTGDLAVRLVAADKAMGIVVKKYFAGFNKTIQNYSQIKDRMDQIKKNITDMKTGLQESRNKLITQEDSETAARAQDIAHIYQQRMEQAKLLEAIKHISWLLQVPLEIKNYISQNYILHAVVLINRATDVGRKPYMEKVVDLVQTIADIKRQREKMAYVVKTNMELLCMKIAMSVNSESMTPSEIEYAKHQQVPQFPYKYKNSDIDAEMCLNESLALKADFDFQEQLIALSSAACILGEKVCQNIITAILESNVESLNVVFGIHRLSPDKKVPVETDFIDQGTFQKIKGKTQHLSSVDRFDLCLKIVLRMICLHALLCAKMEEFKGKMVEYNQSIDVDELEVSFAATKDERVRESITSKRSRWGRRIAKPKIIESMFTEQKEEKHVELQQTKSFVKSSLEFVWDKIQKFLYKVLVLRIFETEENATKNITETKPFVFANAEDGGDKDESEKYKLARKTLTAENVRKLLASLENFLKNVKDTCMFDEESKYSIIEKCITLIKKDLKDNKYTM